MELQNLSLLGYALITGGGTVAPVDAVRVWANDAEGDTSVAVARKFVERGIKVVLILSKLAWYKHQVVLADAIAAGKIVVLVYYTYAEYVARIRQAVEEHGQPAYAVATAAVSDFGHLERPKNKIRSSGPKLTITAPALPKEIDNWRALFGEACRIIGFKLLTRNDDTEESLVAAARKQNARARLTATIANFKEDTSQANHSIWFVLADGRAFRVGGTGEERADAIVAFAVSTKVKASTTLYLRCRKTGRVLMLRRGNGGPHPNKWVPPGGGEDPADVELAARLGVSIRYATGVRETHEEAIVDLAGTPEPAAMHWCVGFSSYTDAHGFTRCWFNIAILVERDEEDEVVPDNFEIVDARWLTIEEVRELLPLIGPLTRASITQLLGVDI